MPLLSKTTTGYYKKMRGKPSEDAVLCKEYADFCLLACSDGHGDAKCKYARRGAELAVWVGDKVIREVRERCETIQDFAKELNDTREQIFQRIVCAWTEAVLDDYKIHHGEDTAFCEKYKELLRYSRVIYEVRDEVMPAREYQKLAQYRFDCENDIYKITLFYGTTLNVAVVCDKFVFALGIGDGDVIAVNGKRVEWLLPSADQFDTNPDSLCGRFSSLIRNFHAVLVPITAGRRIKDNRFQPEFVLLATDGLRNAFLGDAEFADKMLEIAELLRKGGGHTFAKSAQQWIEERAQFGVTQDDVSFCLHTKHALRPPRGKKGARKGS
ncbi:MAG: protein phosphatase 2C domain-containing protein [Ruminococcaceae bacterium]|nr:protein phosphatase 2C domain-containing protein [Oscillospiraceae bacterium]